MKSFSLIIIILLFVYSNAQVNQTTGTIEKIDKSTLHELIKNRNDKLLILNIWATWCLPCREEFPDLKKISKKFSNEVELVGISIDYPDEIESKILPFIKKNSVDFKIYVNNFDPPEALINFLNEKWSGAIPVTFIYSKDGDLKEFIEGKQDFKFFSKKITALSK